MPYCVDCGSRCIGRRCKACGIERANDHWQDQRDADFEASVAVRCDCGFEGTWDPDPDAPGSNRHAHDLACDDTTRYQGIDDDGSSAPPRTPTQHGGAPA